MCQNDRKRPIIRSNDLKRRDNTSPDIITVSDCIATLSEAGQIDQMDQVFEEAVKRGIVLRNNALDVQWEVDLSGMPFPVARAACRHLLRNLVHRRSKSDDVQDMIFITGIGKAQQLRKEGRPTVQTSVDLPSNILDKKDPTTSLRDFVQGILTSDFEPSLPSIIPERAKGTVVIEKEALSDWLNKQ